MSAQIYSLDITGRNPSNLSIGEIITLSTKTIRASCPQYGAYFTNSLVVYDNVTNVQLVRGTHYLCSQLLQDASSNYGQEIALVILIVDPTVSSTIRINCQYLGGGYEQTATVLANLQQNISNVQGPINWVDVLNKPAEFNPSVHNHSLDQVYGFETIVTAIERLGNTIVLADAPAFQYVTEWVYQQIANLALPGGSAKIGVYGTPWATIQDFINQAYVGNLQVNMFSGDSITTHFTISTNPGSQNNLDVTVGGIAQRPGIDYTWSSAAPTTVIFTSAPVTDTNNIVITYRNTSAVAVVGSDAVSYTPASTGIPTSVQATLDTLIFNIMSLVYTDPTINTFSGDGTTVNFTFTGNPGSQNNLDVTVFGSVQRPGIDYTWTPNYTLTFTTAPTVGTNNIQVKYGAHVATPSVGATAVTYTQSGTSTPSTVQAQLDKFNTNGSNVITDNVNTSLWNTVKGFIQYLLSSAGSSVVGFLQAGVGAVPTTVQAKLRESVSVFDFMTAAQVTAWSNLDFSLDITSAIAAAHTAAIALNYAAVIFPRGGGTFSSLTWSPHIQAKSQGKVYLQTSISSGRAIQISDQYGRPALYGLNSIRNTVWNGQFFLTNTNASNTATAWSFGGATSSYYCGWCTALSGVETRSFHGCVYEFRNNVALIDFQQCFAQGNNGSQILSADPTTNSGEGIRFFGCIFGSSTGYLVDINSVHLWSLDFIACSCDYTAGLNKPGNSAPLTSVNWSGGHIEWNQISFAHLQNDSLSTWNIDGAVVAPTALSGWPTYVISKTTNAGTTRFIHIKYVLPGALNYLHQLVSSTSKGSFDFSPNYQNGNTPTNYLADSSGSAIVGYDGITFNSSDYSPTLSGTLGNGTLTGRFSLVGNRVDVNITHTKGTTTTYNTGTLVLGLPIASRTGRVAIGSWWLNNYGIGGVTGVAKITGASASVTLYTAAGVSIDSTAATAWGNGSELDLSITYFTL